MEIKKYPNAILENYSKILIQLGLVLALFIVYETIKMKTYPKQIKGLTGSLVSIDETEEIIEIKPIELQEQPVTKTVVSEQILKVDDEVEIQETIIESTETDQSDAIMVNFDKDMVKVVEEEEVIEDVAFMVIEEVPIFPGCKGNNEERRACFSNQVSKFVSRKFNAELSSELGLSSGSIQKIFVMFKINNKGKISDIRARAPHKKLQEEAIRVVSALPEMTPGKQRGRPVGVSYGLPIVFRVE